ncbi:L-lysine exporter family protein LysE/ArgO [Desulfonispora thiosulfatigenes DSM 11270]|uniref:L-lysine exporter family protein LysE/ArgO n=1 Tax=Desulfonispora thiosulfatigenes DSM 11270 TaxID=656914 RepID=A0A1W1UV23_DESTI|nr:LysE family transporter [Desulfonispora thiosulfatigenes]SMB84923.1 L-lysine exporter family protein LysE/ArgO [Desulfonispora thiosulfatigenes DSM 11270]
MFTYIVQGFLLGLAYLVPIGMQNLYIINFSLRKNWLTSYQVALAVIFFDITLALACFYGMGIIIEKSLMLKAVILLVGSIAIIFIGYGLIKSTPTFEIKLEIDKPFKQILLACFLVTWANPQAIIDGSLLLGGYRASLPMEGVKLFILGVCLASFFWFMGLTTVIQWTKKSFTTNILKALNRICGVIVIIYGLKLAYNFIQMILL